MWTEALSHLRERHAAGGRINYIGGPADSITDGLGASARERGWWDLFARSMARQLGQPTRAIGSAEIAPDSTWPVWTASGPPATDTTRSLGCHGMAILRDGVVRTVQSFDRVRLVIDHTTESFGHRGGTLEIRIDDVDVARIDCSRSDVVGQLWDSGPLGGFEARSIELRCVAGEFVSVGHSYFHDGADGTTGPLFWRNAHARFTASAGQLGFAQVESTWAGALTSKVIGRSPFNDRDILGGGAIDPDCFLICTGTNDLQLIGDNRALIAGTYENMVDYIRARCGDRPSIGIIVPTASIVNGGDYAPLVDGVLRACRASGAFMIDLCEGVGSHADDAQGFYCDGFHPNDRGHAAWADYVSRWMLTAVQLEASSDSG